MKFIILLIVFLASCSKNLSFNESLNEPIIDEIIDKPIISDKPIIEDKLSDFDEFIKFFESTINEFKTYSLNIYDSYTFKSNNYFSDLLMPDINYNISHIKEKTLARPKILRDVKWIVIHDTGNISKGSNAYNHSIYLSNLAIENKKSISWHYTVDDKSIYNHIPDNEVAYHAGDRLTNIGEGNYLGGGNKFGIGIEMCVNEGNDILKTYKLASKLTAKKLIEHNLDVSRVKKHFDFSNKLCPNTIIKNNFWDEFIKLVNIEYVYLTRFSNFKIEILESNNINSQGLYLNKFYSIKLKIIDTLTNNYIIKKWD